MGRREGTEIPEREEGDRQGEGRGLKSQKGKRVTEWERKETGSD